MARLYDDVPDHGRRRPDPPESDTRDGEGNGDESAFPDRMGFGRRRRDRDLHQIDRMHCLSTGDKARSDYVTEHEPAMRQRETDFKTAQTDYLAARSTVAAKLGPLKESVAKIRVRVLCWLEHMEQEKNDLDHSWARVQSRLRHCEGHQKLFPGDDDCEFDFDLDHPTLVLVAMRAQYTTRVETAEEQFTALLEEPDLLLARGTALEDEVAALGSAVNTEDPDVIMCYASLLVVEYHLEQIWGPFDTANAYDDALRACLRCSVRGHRALIGIVGELAVRECREIKRKERCNELKAHLVDEIIAEYAEIQYPCQRAED